MRKLIYLLAILLSACGGSGASISSVGGSTLSIPSDENIFPDMREIYSRLCGNETLIQTVVPIDLNNDGKKDLLLSAWCDLNGQKLIDWPIGSEYRGPVPNSVIALLQKPDGTFELGNKQLFGVDILALEGQWGYPAIGDFNNDGKSDIAFSTNLEDGRAPVTFSDGTNNFTSHVQVLLSGGAHPYTLYTIGEPSVSMRLNVTKENNRDMLSFNDRAYYFEGSWKSYSYTNSNNALAYYQDNNVKYSISQIFRNNQFGIELMRQQNSSWSSIDTYVLPNMRLVDTYDSKYGSNGYTQQYLITIDGTDWLTPSLNDGCVIKDTPTEKVFSVVFQGIKLRNKYTGQLLEFANDLGPYVGQILIVTVQNNIMTSVTTDSNLYVENYFSQICLDVDNDQSNDIVITRWTGANNSVKPSMFMNKKDIFAKVPSEVLPPVPEYYNGNASYIADIDSDGKADIIYFPLLGMKPGYTGSVKLMLYKNNGQWN